MLIAGGRIVTSDRIVESGWVQIQGDRFVATGIGDPHAEPDLDLQGRTLVPGFVDQHCHGGGGHSFITTDAEEATRAAKFHQQHGTTSLIGSLVTGSREALIAQIETLIPLVDSGVLEGIHLEGPWISPRYCGAHDVSQLRDPKPADVGELLAVGAGRIKMVTIAPELPGAMDAIHQIVGAGALAAVGHTNADFRTTLSAIEAGARVATHLPNAMRPLHHRDPGAFGALMSDPRVTVELVADGTHVHPAVVRLIMNGAGLDRIAAITDAMPAAGAPDGRYMLGTIEVDVVDGVARLVEGGAIAGSTLTMDKALRWNVQQGGTQLLAACTALSLTPARCLGLTDRGSIAAGNRADLVMLGYQLRVDAVMVGGEWVHEASPQ